MKKQFTTGRIFDLDGTVIDSSQRVVPCLKPNGDLDLDKYIAEACTPQKVMRDKLLPLVGLMKQAIANGELVIICTARHMLKHDYIFLRQNGLRVPMICSRDTLKDHFHQRDVNRIYKSGDGAYKKAWLAMLQARYPDVSFTMYDDHPEVLEVAQSLGIKTVCAVNANEQLKAALKLDAECEAVIDQLHNELIEDANDIIDAMMWQLAES
ncbi:deoxynucleoside-5'-monophosphatase [Vibrio phage VCPH]|nr:deoxynucleoside-5'-monophosphatase [Vibrio phage VCPH]